MLKVNPNILARDEERMAAWEAPSPFQVLNHGNIIFVTIPTAPKLLAPSLVLAGCFYRLFAGGREPRGRRGEEWRKDGGHWQAWSELYWAGNILIINNSLFSLLFSQIVSAMRSHQ